MDLYWSPYTIRFENPFKEGATNDSASTQAINKIPSYLRTFEGTKVVYEGKSYLRTFVSNTFVSLKGAFESCLIGVGSLSAHKRTLTPPR